MGERIERFEDLVAWQRACELHRRLHQEAFRHPAFAKAFALRDQLERAASSTMANIDEGYERSGAREFAHGLSIAKGSKGEVRSHLYAARDAGYLQPELFESLRALAEALEPPTPKLKAWMSRWAGRIAASVHEEDDGRVSRRGFDLLWEDLAADPPVDDASGRAFRGVLAAIEDLVRREERPRERKSAAGRRVQIVEALGCLK